MWKYIKRYLPFGIIGGLFMCGEVTMDLLQPRFMNRIVDEGVLGIGNGGVGNLRLILLMGAAMIAVALFGGLCGSMNNVFVHIFSQNTGNEMRKDAFDRIMQFSFGQADGYGAGTLVTRMTNDITQVQNFVSTFVRGMIRTSMLMLGSLFFLFRLNVHFGILMLCAIPLVAGIILFCVRKASPLFPQLQSNLDDINSVMQEDVSGIRIIKACVREIYEKVRFGKANDQLIATQLKSLLIFAFMNPCVTAILYSVITLLIVIGNNEVINNTATPGNIMAAITYATTCLNGINGVIMIFQNITRGSASWVRVRELLETEPELKDGSYDHALQEKGKGEIIFEHVSFTYPGTRKEILHDINLTIPGGSTVAIMGATGCGKSTLISLIPRFYEASSGHVLLDGIDVRDYAQKDLRDRIAICLQKAELFSRSIAENIRWGNPSATEEEVEAAGRIAQAEEFILRQPQGYQTPVAERGMSLSGGQKQRLSIARAVLKNAAVLIFDDSTSALDLKTEADLYAALQEARPNTTKIIIAQRIASVRRADAIVVLGKGRVIAVGTHEELKKNCKEYRDIYDSQLGEEE